MPRGGGVFVRFLTQDFIGLALAISIFNCSMKAFALAALSVWHVQTAVIVMIDVVIVNVVIA